ncbi:LDAH hydrolase, partial [Rhodinocichla rosea]|nr:LDAH hydrolase [Rhodinocichla rosea]
ANMGSEEPVPLHEEFIYCCGAATHVLKCGPWKDLSKDESKNLPRLLFMIIPGNPGLAGYYRTFIQALYCGLNQQYPVWVVSHAGHCKPPSGMEMIEDTDIKELEDVFGLNGQVEHKLNFLKKNVSKDIKLVLIAHSIGCYITLEMMKRASELQNIYFLSKLTYTTDVISHVIKTFFLQCTLCDLRLVTFCISFILDGECKSVISFTKRSLHLFLLSCFSQLYRLCHLDWNIANILYMASQEMMKVVERDSTTIKQNLKKLIFYYGTGDSWCPQHYYDEIKMDFPDGDIRLCEKGLRHAFVLDASKEMAAMITDWLQDDLTKL